MGLMRSELQVRLKEQLDKEELVPPGDSGDPLVQLQNNPCVTGYHRIPAREASWVDLPASLDPRFTQIMTERGVSRLYSHQVECYENAARAETRSS